MGERAYFYERGPFNAVLCEECATGHPSGDHGATTELTNADLNHLYRRSGTVINDEHPAYCMNCSRPVTGS